MKFDLMQIVFIAPGVAEYQPDGQYDTNNLAADQVVVKTCFSTISPGTERANLIGEKAVSILGNESPFPRYLGYSSSGVVVAVGSAVSSVNVGDRVAVYDGTHVNYNVVPEQRVIKLPDGVTHQDGALGFIASFPLAAVRKVEVEPGESVAVFGLGLLGQLAVRFARIAGSIPIVAVDLVKGRRDVAALSGADYVFDPRMQDFAEKVKDVASGGINACIEVTGVGAGLNQALDVMKKFGRVALLGCTRNSDFSVDFYKKVHGPGITLVGAHSAARPATDSRPHCWTIRDDISAVFKLVAGGRLTLSDLVGEVRSPSECTSVYNRLADGKDFPICVQFDWRGNDEQN